MVGKEGKLNQRMQVPAGNGSWVVMAEAAPGVDRDCVDLTDSGVKDDGVAVDSYLAVDRADGRQTGFFETRLPSLEAP